MVVEEKHNASYLFGGGKKLKMYLMVQAFVDV